MKGSERSYPPLAPDGRILMGPGPSNLPPEVRQALAQPLWGHLDPRFLALMDEVKEMLRRTLRTENRLTLPISGTGSAGMEAALVNFVAPGEEVVVGVNGVFGERMAEVAARCGAHVIAMEAPWGEVIPPWRILDALDRHPRVSLVGVVHAETSTGIEQPLEEIGQACQERETLFLVDGVTSLGGIPLEVDAWGIDICYSATQKCLSVPPGLAPLTVSPRAVDRLRRRERIQSWYFDLRLIENYWGSERAYHHTAPVSLIYALREGLRLVLEEGLEARWERHREMGSLLRAELAELGFTPFGDPEHALPVLTAVHPPSGLDEGAVRSQLLEEYGIEVGGGLGETAGKIWRIGLMGEGCRRERVLLLLSSLKDLLENPLATGRAV